jgi:hypothetical protein
MSTKTSTAALDSRRPASSPKPCRVPCHPAGASKRPSQRSKPSAKENHTAAIRHSEWSLRSEESLFSAAVALAFMPAPFPCSGRLEAGRSSVTEFQQAQIAIYQEDPMNSAHQNPSRTIRTIFPVILRITFSLILWTLGAAPMRLAAAETKEHRVVYTFAADRAQIEDLQRWVNAGHDSWCRDPRLVASASLQRVLPDSDFELASFPLEREHSRKATAVYTFHSLDGTTTYRITLRRYRWLLPVAGSRHKMIWVPERAEIVTRDAAKSTPTSISARS